MSKTSDYRSLPIRIPDEVVDFDQEAFSTLIRRVGVPLVHFKAFRSPVGMENFADLRKPNEDHSGASNGFLYKRAGIATCLFTSVSNNNRIMDLGEMDGSNVSVTLPSTYDDSDAGVRTARYDRFYLTDPNITVVNWQLFTTSEVGVERLTYPISEVEYIVDSYGTEYTPNDYVLENGQIKWVGNRPPPNKVCSIRYMYRPYWYVSRVIHEVRVTNKENIYTGTRETIRMPQMVQLQREYVFESEQRDIDSTTPDSPRQAKAPPDGSFGPR